MKTLNAKRQLFEADNAVPALVVLGRDEGNKPHASWFADADAEAAVRTAAAMDMQSIRVSAGELERLASRLPRGRLFASGKAFVPFVSRDLFDELLAFVPVAALLRPLRLVKTDEENKGNAPAVDEHPKLSPTDQARLPSDWSNIKTGSLVLACEGPAMGWFEAIVVTEKPDDRFELFWRDYPAQGNFVRHRLHLGLMYCPPKSA